MYLGGHQVSSYKAKSMERGNLNHLNSYFNFYQQHLLNVLYGWYEVLDTDFFF